MVRLCGVWHTSQSLDPVPHLSLAGFWSTQRHKLAANHKAPTVKHFFCFKTSCQNLTLRSSKKPVFTPFYPHPPKAIFHCAFLSLVTHLSLRHKKLRNLKQLLFDLQKANASLLQRLHRYLWSHPFRNNLMV